MVLIYTGSWIYCVPYIFAGTKHKSIRVDHINSSTDLSQSIKRCPLPDVGKLPSSMSTDMIHTLKMWMLLVGQATHQHAVAQQG